MLSANALEQAVENAREYARRSPFEFEFYIEGSSCVQIRASGRAAGRSFGDNARLKPVADISQLKDSVDDLVGRLRSIADRFHRGLPYPIYTWQAEERLGAVGQVDLAIDEFVGVRLRGIGLEKTLFLRFLLERRSSPAAGEAIVHRGVPIVIEGTGVTYLFDD